MYGKIQTLTLVTVHLYVRKSNYFYHAIVNNP